MPEDVERNLSSKRILYLIALFVVFLSGILILSAQNHVLMDEMLCMVIFTISFWGILVLQLMRKRLDGDLVFSGTSYKNVFIYITICWIVELISSYIPEYLFPIGLIVFFLATLFETEILFGLGLYFCIMLCLLCQRGTYTIYCYCLLLLVNTFLALYIRQLPSDRRALKLCSSVLVVSYNLFIPSIFYYFTYLKIGPKTLLTFLGIALLTGIFSFFGFNKIWEFNQREEYVTYDELLEDDYPLVMDLKRFSKVEYNHSRKVSYLAEICGTQIGCNSYACACGGLYYRLGKLLGKPEIENAVKEATNRCFPPDVIGIIYEYEGKKRRPQSVESAVVHMVDTIVTKIEILDKDTMSSQWNQEMLIYQTLNELSSSGIYDESGLSMNQFLLIREIMAHQNIGDYN